MKLIDISDEELVSCVLGGDSGAFAILVSRYTNVLSSIAFLKVRNPEDVRDIVQETFVIAYCNLDQLDTPGSFGAWIRGIALNRCRKVLDKRTRAQRFLEKLPHTVEIPDPAREVAVKENARQVLQALDTLNDLHREIVMLYYFQDLKVDGIAHLVNRPVGTIKRILSEARGKLKEELIEMAREEFSEFNLTEEQRRRLEMIPVFPREEPKITTSRLPDSAGNVKKQAPYGNFPALSVDAESHYADYDYPSRKLGSVTHVKVEGPFEVNGKQALRYDNLSFTVEGKIEGIWRPYCCIEGDTVLYCGKQSSGQGNLLLITPNMPEWDEPQPQLEPLEIVPGFVKEPNGDQDGFIVDTNLWEVRIGRRSFQCLRREGGGGKHNVEWSDVPISWCATEEFFLPDGRMLLWRRYNGMGWSMRNPGRKKDAPGTYEQLEEAGVPMLEFFGEKYYLWYDQIPDYALRLQ